MNCTIPCNQSSAPVLVFGQRRKSGEVDSDRGSHKWIFLSFGGRLGSGSGQAGEVSAIFFTFRVKRENVVVVFCFPRFVLFSVVKRNESGDSLHVREFHCKRDHPNSVGSLSCLVAQVVSVVLDL